MNPEVKHDILELGRDTPIRLPARKTPVCSNVVTSGIHAYVLPACAPVWFWVLLVVNVDHIWMFALAVGVELVERPDTEALDEEVESFRTL